MEKQVNYTKVGLTHTQFKFYNTSGEELSATGKENYVTPLHNDVIIH